MVSVLIPVYNTDVRNLVRQLHDQLNQDGIAGEILCIDDASDDKIKILNQEINLLPSVRTINLDQNIGRSKIRNRLAQEAKFDCLIYMDCDHTVINESFIKNYLRYKDNSNFVVYGGTTYGAPPTDPKLILHWKYGRDRECIPAEKRNQNRFGTFKTNNFFLPKSVFTKMKFNEGVKGYGHEDTLFAKDLERNGFELVHIENPLQHDGLELNTVFLEKQKNALKNLVILYKDGKVGREIRLIRFYEQMKKLGLLFLVRTMYLKDEKKLIDNLFSDQPSLGNLDRLKLGWFMKLVGS